MSDITDLQEERLKQLADRLKETSGWSDIPDHVFADIIYSTVSFGHVSEEQFRDEFGLTANAVQRWMTGKNLPQPDVRPVILRWILSVLENSET